MAIYLGFDSSTQGLTVTAIEVDGAERRVLLTRSLAFDAALPQYGTRHGVLPGDPPTAVSSPLMWAEALDMMMAEVAASGIDLSRVAAISGSAQQHGSVYLNAATAERLRALDPARPLAAQLDGIFSRDVSPIWMDSSTAEQCREIEAAIGGADALTRLTGSRAFERFTGPQIRKFWQTDPAAYARTDRVHLVSSYLASLLAGRHAPVDTADASGMNLMDIATGRWAPEALAATAPELDRRLPPLVPSATVVGRLSDYWVTRYGFPRAAVVAWSGDNPCSLVGTGLVTAGRWSISLGTSDTVFAYMAALPGAPFNTSDAPFNTSDAPFSTSQHPSAPFSTLRPGAGHLFAAPTGAWMGITVFKNGSLARERIRDEYGLDWRGFSNALRATPPGSAGLLFPWFVPEITPPVSRPGVHRFGVGPDHAAANVRALVDTQAIAMRRHSGWMGERVDVIHATGGAAANREILQVFADVFGAEVRQLAGGNSAALGAAIRAYHADQQHRGRGITWERAIGGFVIPAGDAVRPVRELTALYARLAARHAACEARALDLAG